MIQSVPSDYALVSDHIARMKQIEKEGNSPQEWKAYITFLKTIPSENNILSKPLSEAYSRAFYVSNGSKPNSCGVVYTVSYRLACFKVDDCNLSTNNKTSD